MRHAATSPNATSEERRERSAFTASERSRGARPPGTPVGAARRRCRRGAGATPAAAAARAARRGGGGARVGVGRRPAPWRGASAARRAATARATVIEGGGSAREPKPPDRSRAGAPGRLEMGRRRGADGRGGGVPRLLEREPEAVLGPQPRRAVTRRAGAPQAAGARPRARAGVGSPSRSDRSVTGSASAARRPRGDSHAANARALGVERGSAAERIVVARRVPPAGAASEVVGAAGAKGSADARRANGSSASERLAVRGGGRGRVDGSAAPGGRLSAPAAGRGGDGRGAGPARRGRSRGRVDREDRLAPRAADLRAARADLVVRDPELRVAARANDDHSAPLRDPQTYTAYALYTKRQPQNNP